MAKKRKKAARRSPSRRPAGPPPDTASLIEQARTELERVLWSDSHWRALGEATLPADRAAHERALADKAVYRAWMLLGQATVTMRAEKAHGAEGAPGRSPAASGGAPLLTPRPRATAGLTRRVLERVGGESPFDSPEPPGKATAAADAPAPAIMRAEPTLPSTARQGVSLVLRDIEVEEADVSFVIREPAGPAPAPAAQDGDEAAVTIAPRRH